MADVRPPIAKRLTGIAGFDDITGGGLPAGRVTTIMGNPGAGKTVFALQTVVNRVRNYGEAGIVVAFEEAANDIRDSMAAFDWRLDQISPDKLIFVDAKRATDTAISGAFDLHGLLAGLRAALRETGARTVVFDGIDNLIGALGDERLERQELIRLDEWVRQNNVSAILTLKSNVAGERDRTRMNFVQYMTDCVVVLEETVTTTTTSRSVRVAKYRGSGFAPNPIPVVFSASGIEVLAFKGGRSDYPHFDDRASSGIARLDTLLGGGYLRGSSILISGSPGTSKTSLAASFVAACCARGEPAVFVSFDESGAQIMNNMRSIGLDLREPAVSGRLTMASLLSTSRSPQDHFLQIRNLLDEHMPTCLVVDPLSALLKAGYPFNELICETLIDTAKSRGITVLCTSLLGKVGGDVELSASHVSTLVDTWIHVSYVAEAGERNRALTIIKSRGTDHSNQVRELQLSDRGIDLADVYVAEGRVLMGSARAQKEAEARQAEAAHRLLHEQSKQQLDHDIAELKARIELLSDDLHAKRLQADLHETSEHLRVETLGHSALQRRALRSGDAPVPNGQKTDDRRLS